jgi:hypothetical protein
MLSKQALDEYKKIFKEEYGIDLSDSDASDQSHRLIELFRILVKVDRQVDGKRHPPVSKTGTR